MEELIPTALVLGCNTPHGIGVLSDWIEEHTGHAPDFADAGWSDHNCSENGYGDIGERNTVGDGRGDGYGYDRGYGHGDSNNIGNGSGDGFGFGYSHGEYSGDGDGCGFGYDYGMWFGEGIGYGLYPDGYSFGANTNTGFWQRIGQRLRQLIR